MALDFYHGHGSPFSWRVWLALEAKGIPYNLKVLSFDKKETTTPEFIAINPRHTVPTIVDDGHALWESLAILEYLAEKFPDARLWPADPAARAHARAIAAEMHAGFVPLRRALPMNMWRPVMWRELAPDVQSNVRRIEAMWTDCRTRYGADGPFLFGRFGAADAMYAPVVSRFHTYDVEVNDVARAYMAAVMALPAWGEWRAAALQEPWVLPEDEVDWPKVLRV